MIKNINEKMYSREYLINILNILSSVRHESKIGGCSSITIKRIETILYEHNMLNVCPHCGMSLKYQPEREIE